MLDFHSHILPAIDDGSQSLDESLKLLDMISEQGVKTVVATPHFYANRRPVEEFLKRREKAFTLLKENVSEKHPDILCGAEVYYYSGITRMPELKKLRIEGTKLLLLEMPMSKWTDYTVREVIELAGGSSITLVIAHMERYMGYQSKKTLSQLYQSGILMQFNASFFTSFSTKRKAISMLKNGEINFIGSDCHNLTDRAPRIGEATEIISKKLGENFLAEFNEYGSAMLKINKKTITI